MLTPGEVERIVGETFTSEILHDAGMELATAIHAACTLAADEREAKLRASFKEREARLRNLVDADLDESEVGTAYIDWTKVFVELANPCRECGGTGQGEPSFDGEKYSPRDCPRCADAE